MQHTIPIIIKQKYNSLEELCIGAKRWDLDFKKITPGSLNAELNMIDMGIIQLSEVKIKGNILQNGSTPTNYKTIIVAGDEMQSYKWQNFNITSEHLLITPKDNKFEAITNKNFHVYTISIHNDYFNNLVHTLGYASLFNKFCNKDALYQINKNHLFLLNSYISVIFKDYLSNEVNYDLTNKLTTITKKLPELMLSFLDENKALKPKVKHRKIDEAALTFINNYNQESIPNTSIDIFCNENSIKQRTLEKAINEYFSISPIALIKALKLNRFRKELVYNFLSVTEAASVSGFKHLGQLSTDYKKLFGETPSETAKQIRT